MFNRLVAENIIKTPFKGQPYFSISKKLLAYSQQQSIKLKGFNKDIKDLQVQLENNSKVKYFQFSSHKPWLYVVKQQKILQIYEIQGQNCNNIKKILQIKSVLSVRESSIAIVLDCVDNYYRVLPFEMVIKLMQQNCHQIQIEKLASLGKKSSSSMIISAPECNNIYTQSLKQGSQGHQNDLNVFTYNNKTKKYQNALQVDYIVNPISIYRDRYVMQFRTQDKNIKALQIYDINQSKQIGKLQVDGELRYSQIRQNLLLVVMSVDNTDYYWFFLLHPNPNQNQSLITHRIVYQKGRGDYYNFLNMKTQEALSINDKKKQILDNQFPQKLDNSTSSIIYVLNKQKQKVEVIKLQHSKILQSPFVQQKIQKRIASNTVKNKIQEQKATQAIQVQRTRIKSSLQHKSQSKSLEETQKRFVEAIVDTKIKTMLRKFEQLQQRVERLEKTIKGIYQKIQQSMNNISRKQIKQSVQNLFQQLTPQFEKYFGQLFKQVSSVLDQGVSYYNKKLAAQAQIHKQALSQIVTKTFDSTKEIVQLSKKEEKLSQRTEKHLNDLLQSRTKWQRRTEEFEQQNKDLSFNAKGPKETGQGKVFIRADLNSASKKQT